ncbi:UNVERIFIED_CONTAM: hypothetical protein FKN15_064494 [Acipenser sinensis]
MQAVIPLYNSQRRRKNISLLLSAGIYTKKGPISILTESVGVKECLLTARIKMFPVCNQDVETEILETSDGGPTV